MDYLKTTQKGWVIDPKTKAVLNLEAASEKLTKKNREQEKEINSLRDKVNRLESLVEKLLIKMEVD